MPYHGCVRTRYVKKQTFTENSDTYVKYNVFILFAVRLLLNVKYVIKYEIAYQIILSARIFSQNISSSKINLKNYLGELFMKFMCT